MKKYLNKAQFSKTLMLFFTIALLTACDKEDDNKCHGIDCLPPATQTGAGTFGCLINEEAFVDTGGGFNCYYQFVDGEYYFSISAENTDAYPRNIRISTSALEINVNNTYELVEPEEGNAHAAVIFNFNGVQPNENTTNMQYSGSLEISMLDFENNIVSGKFNFQIFDTMNNEVFNITNGRFDSHFTE